MKSNTKVWLCTSNYGHHLYIHYIVSTKAEALKWLKAVDPYKAKLFVFNELMNARHGRYWDQTSEVRDSWSTGIKTMFFWDRKRANEDEYYEDALGIEKHEVLDTIKELVYE